MINLITVDVESLRTFIRATVDEVLNEKKKTRERISKKAASDKLGICYNTLTKMMILTNRDHLYADELENFKEEYETIKLKIKRNEKQRRIRRIATKA